MKILVRNAKKEDYSAVRDIMNPAPYRKDSQQALAVFTPHSHKTTFEVF